MLRVEPRSYADVRGWLASLGIDCPECVPARDAPLAPDHPVLHVPYRDVPSDVLDHALGFSGILEADAPVGLQGIQDAQRVSTGGRDDFLFFPLLGLSQHLAGCASQRRKVLGLREGSDPSADDELEFITAVADIVHYCQAEDCALAIRW